MAQWYCAFDALLCRSMQHVGGQLTIGTGSSSRGVVQRFIMGSAASSVRFPASKGGISGERYCVEEDMTSVHSVQSCPIPAVEKADPQLQPTRVFAFDAEEWERTFGQMSQNFQSNTESQESQG
eukprot:Skav211783  [mRNA]  locus=scaffold305:149656:150027:+ [translate_table: standard]